MNEPKKKLSKRLMPYMIFILGVAVGSTALYLFMEMNVKYNKSGYVEKHEGQNNYINPLLACDVADNVIANSELVPFKEKIEYFLNKKMDKSWASKVSVYYRELNDGYWFSIGETDKFVPASMKKVPLMIALLKQAESDITLLERSVTFDLANDYNAVQKIKSSQKLVVGNKYTIRDLIYRMIAYSDNNSYVFLTKYVNQVLLNNAYSDLRIITPGTNTDDDFLSVQTYESFFRILYNASYLNRTASNWALETLAKAEFKDGLVAGVPKSTIVAHKFGEHIDANDGTVQLHDCGVVYYPNNPYLLCVMSKGVNFHLLDDVIAEVSRITYSEVDRQQKQRSH